jgi:hypothetical protein
VLWGEYLDYILIVTIGESLCGKEDWGDDLGGDYGCVINGDFLSLGSNWLSRTALHLSLPPFIPKNTWHVPTVTAEDFPEGEEDDNDEEGSVVVTEGREGFSSGLELSRILGDILER